MSAALADSFNGSGGEDESDSLFQFRHIDALFLEIDIFPDIARRIELGSTSAVGVTSTHFRALI